MVEKDQRVKENIRDGIVLDMGELSLPGNHISIKIFMMRREGHLWRKNFRDEKDTASVSMPEAIGPEIF